MQPLIKEYEDTGAIHSLEYNSWEDIERNREEKFYLDRFKDSFMDSDQWIEVEKSLEENIVFYQMGVIGCMLLGSTI